jgi:iron complex outermembrane recepter protein
MMVKLQRLAWMASLSLILVTIPVLGGEVKSASIESDNFKRTNLKLRSPKVKIPNQQRLAQSPIAISGVRLQSTDKGIDVILETNQSEQLKPVVKTEGNNYIVDIPNAQLRLPSGNTFRQEKPSAGITEVIVSNLDANTIRVTVRGETNAPQVELFDGDEGLIFGVIPAVSTAETPQTQPTPPQPEQPSAQNEEPIELVVTGEQDGYRVEEASTATRTDTPLRDIPQTIQVVPEEVIRDQRVTRLRDALLNVGGVTQDGGFGGTADQLGIRGFFGGGVC